MRTITAETESERYPIYIGSGISADTGILAAEKRKPGKAALITDHNVDRLHSKHIRTSLEKAGFETQTHVIPAGEQSKNTSEYIGILRFLSEKRLSRSDTVFALGGGLVGDIAGFAAATYLRGTGLVHIPTTLLAAVDSSVGGKTAVNLEMGKNLAGTFYQPDMVICDTDLLSTLPEDTFREGCAEIIKYGVIADRPLFEMLRKPVKERIEEIIARCLNIKCRLVFEDEFDTGPRQLLNFGHTFGHAVEKCSGYGVSHGKAVAIGMVMAACAAAELEICGPECPEQISDMVRDHGLPDSTDISKEALLNVVLSDKKRSGEGITFVFPEEIGRCRLEKFPLADIKKILDAAYKWSAKE